ncbi:MAG TPA: cytochrome c peroxidase [Candidatus Limnocylindrales bacterium]|nr:cytochrome c peroxidase [Candidatus Limnocylindrales bacterium]
MNASKHWPLNLLRTCTIALAIVAALGYLARVKAQSGTAPTGNVITLRPLAALSSVPIPDVPGIGDYVANKQAAIVLGKTLFWDMQAGSDGVQACASCHFNAGADSRVNNALSPGLKAGDSTFQMGVPLNGKIYPNYTFNAGTPGAGFGGYHDGDFPLHKQGDVNTRNNPLSDVNDTVGSQGVFSTSFDRVRLGSSFEKQTISSDAVFSYPDPANSANTINTRRVEPRNTPSAVNAIFNNRSFWDGRAQNTCNGANPFGERDTSSHFYSASSPSAPLTSGLVRLQNSSLCSQALGPPGSNFEMSASNRTFRDIGTKLLFLRPLSTGKKSPLGAQKVDPTDSVLGSTSVKNGRGLQPSYVDLIKAAFQPKWWQSSGQICVPANGGAEIVIKMGKPCPTGTTGYFQMEYNFSLFWGIAIQMYESTLVADQTPLDNYLKTQKTVSITGDNVKNWYSVQLAPGVDPYTVSVVELNPQLDSSDQEVFAFDDGAGNVSGEGVTQASIDYASGTLSIQFDVPPPAAFPINISYSVGPTPLTQAQLRGLLTFQTKGRCINCHGGPELSNASVGNVSIQPLERMVMGDFNVRVYDNGFYNIGVRPGKEDISLGDVDGAAGQPLSQSELLRERVCNDPGFSMMIPGRPGDSLPAAPLSCWDDIARTGFFKTPMLRNIALTAPYFHNGGQLTIEQVIEFYNRGGDFPDGFDQIPLIDPNIVPLGLTMQEKTDLADFLRNALTDPRTVNQSAPFDHPELFVPNGHPADANGYPVQNDPKHPGQATDRMLQIPAVGRNGGTPLRTFLQNLNTH